jgi:hypothetical protein
MRVMGSIRISQLQPHLLFSAGFSRWPQRKTTVETSPGQALVLPT